MKKVLVTGAGVDKTSGIVFPLNAATFRTAKINIRIKYI